MKSLLIGLTGVNRVLSPQLRTRERAVRAGPSLPLVRLRVPTRLPQEIW